MAEFIKPDRVHSVEITGGELILSEAYDVLHFWKTIDFHMLKYWNQETRVICDIPLNRPSAMFLVENCGTLVLPRVTITEHEHKIYLDWMVAEIDELDFKTSED